MIFYRSFIRLPSYVLFILLLLYSSNNSTKAFVLTVPADDEHCFHVKTLQAPYTTVSGNFDVLTDDLDPSPITVAIFGRDLKELYTSPMGVREDAFSVAIPHQNEKLTVCVSNGHGYYTSHHEGIQKAGHHTSKHNSDGKDRVVGLQIRVTRPQSQGLSEDASDLLELALDVQDDLNNFQNHLGYLKNREAQHRTLVESTFTRVVNWNIFEFAVLVLVSCGQILFIKRFFEKRRFM